MFNGRRAGVEGLEGARVASDQRQVESARPNRKTVKTHHSRQPELKGEKIVKEKKEEYCRRV